MRRSYVMRTMIAGLAIGVLVFGSGSAGAQEAAPAQTTFSGIKLLDMKARTPERSVTLVFGRDSLRILDPASNTVLRTLEYSGLRVTHAVSSAPPASAGDANAAATQPMSMPMYMGKTPRNWLTLESGGATVTLRVSAKVYDRVKSALDERRVPIDEVR
jgi:hypothetical protein